MDEITIGPNFSRLNLHVQAKKVAHLKLAKSRIDQEKNLHGEIILPLPRSNGLFLTIFIFFKKTYN